MAEYGVNIKITANTTKLDLINKKANQLASAVDKVNSINLSDITSFKGTAGQELKKTKDQLMGMVAQVNATNKAFGTTIEQQEGALQGFEELRRSMTVGTDDFNKTTQAINKQTEAMKNQNKQFGINQKNQRNPRGNSAALKSGLVSGAFPLLFGQGPLGAAAGFTGGLIGGKLGGQTGGFAGGLVATAVLTQVQQLFDSTSKLGQAFSRLTPDVEGLTKALGANGTERERQIQLIKKTEGTQAALAAVTEQMNKAIGADAVKGLKDFGEVSRLIGNQFQILGTKMLAALLPVLNLLATPFAGPAQRAERDRLAEIGGSATDPTLLALQTELANVSGSGKGRSGTKQAEKERARISGLIEARKEELALIGKGLERQTTINLIEDSRLKKVRQQNALLQAKIDGNYEEVLLAQELDAKIKEMIEDGATMEELDVKKIENLLKQNNALEKQAQQAEMIRQQFKSLGQSLATDVADGLQGLIRGTSTLNDMLNNVLNKLIDAAFNMALFGNPGGTLGGGGLFGSIFKGFGSMFGGGGPTMGGGGYFDPVTGLGVAGPNFGLANGGTARAGSTYMVGERGPELFSPGVTGTVTPNHALGGTTNVVVNVDASGTEVQGDEDRGRELGRLISVAVQSEIVQQKRPGGLLA